MQAIRAGKILADAEVTSKLYARACGYVTRQNTKLYRQDDGSVREVPYMVEYRPDTPAGSLWLRNRRPDLWREKRELEVAETTESLMDGMGEGQLIELLMLRRGAAQRKPS